MTTSAGVIATFNQEEYILEAVASLAGSVDEIIVIDDASTDATGDLLDRMSYDNLRVIHNETSRGVSRAFNTAIALASSDVILIQGGDDRSLPTRAMLQKAAMADAGVAMVYSNPRVINAAGRLLPTWLAPEFSPEPADPLAALALGNNFICAPSAAFRRTDFLEVGGFHAGLDLLQDHDLWLRLAERGDLRKLSDPVVEYRKHGSNISRDYVGLDSPKQRRIRVEQEFVANHFIEHSTPESRLRMARAIGLDMVAFAAMTPEDQMTMIQLSHPDRIVLQRGVARLVALAGGPDPDAALARLGLTLRDLDRFSSLADHDGLGELQRALSIGGAMNQRSSVGVAKVDPEARVDVGSRVDASAVIWRGAHVRENAKIGAGTSLGQFVYVGPGAIIGSNCKVQNGAMIYEPAVVGDGVFIGPGVVLTNDRAPRAVTVDGRPKSAADWTAVGVRIDDGASLGARVVCVAPVVVGSWALVAAGAVVTRDVVPYALMAGVPAKRVGWVGRAGERLVRDGEDWVCPIDGSRFREDGEAESARLTPLDSEMRDRSA